VWKSTQPYFTDAQVDTTLWVAGDTDIPGHTRTEYDGAGRPAASVYFAGATERWRTTTGYGGDRVHVTPPAGATATTTINDARGQTVELRRHTTPEPGESFDTTRYTYTPAGQLASVTDPADSTWRYTYDLRGRKTTVEDPDSGTTTMTYDNAGRLSTSRDARGATLAHAYDALGRKTGTFADQVGGAKLAEWAYDTVPLGKGHLTSATRWVDDTPYVDKVLGYDELYQPTGTAVVIPAVEGLLSGTYESYFSYGPDGSLSGVDYPAAGELPAETVNYTYHDLGLPKSSSGGYDGATFRHVGATEYTSYGELARVQLGSGTKRAWLSHYYDTNTRRLNRSIVDAEVPAPMQADTHYTYDPAGNITSIADTPQAQPSNVDVQCFGHDHLRRVTQAWTPAVGTWSETTGCRDAPAVAGLTGPAPYWHSYTFDDGGNRHTETRHAAAGDTVRDYTYDVPGHAHALGSVSTNGPGVKTVDSYAYHPSGQTATRTVGGTTQELSWDAEGRLDKVTAGGKETSFVHGADGARLIRRAPDATTLYLGNQELRLNRAGGDPTVTRYYTHGGTTVAVRQGSGALTWLAGDHQATAQIAINSGTLAVTRRRQLPYGAPRGAKPAFPGERGFVGGTLDASTGLTHLGAREYDPATGRFISVDPIMDLANPDQMNGYGYANGNPVTFSDPSGLIPVSCPDGECRGGSYGNSPGPATTYNPPVNHTPSGVSGTKCGARPCSDSGTAPPKKSTGCGARPCKTGSFDPHDINFTPKVPVQMKAGPAPKKSEFTVAACASGGLQRMIAAGGYEACLAVDRYGMGWSTANKVGAGYTFGTGVSADAGFKLAQGSIEDLGGMGNWAALDVGRRGSAEVGRSTDGNWSVSGAVGVSAGTGSPYSAGTEWAESGRLPQDYGNPLRNPHVTGAIWDGVAWMADKPAPVRAAQLGIWVASSWF
jgi:RHS repeat-associated protein